MSARTTEFAAQITGDANGAVAALEKVKTRVQETAKAAESANTKVADSTGVLIKQSEKAAKGVASITQALYAMEAEGSARVLAIGGAIGNFADLLGPGGKVVSGIAIVTASIAALFLQAKEKSAEATKAIEDDIKQLVNAGDFAKITKRLQEIEQGTAGESFNDGRSAIRARIEQLKEEASAVGKSSRFYRERQEAIIEENKKLGSLNSEYDRYLKALTDTRNAPTAPRGLAGAAIVTSADSTEKVAADAKRAAEAWMKLEKAASDAEEKLSKAAASAIAQATKALESLNDETSTRLRLTLDQATAEKLLINGRELSLTAAAEELAAALKGEEAYKKLTQERLRNAFVEAELEKARAAAIARGTVLTSAQILEIRAQAALTFDLRDGAAAAAAEFGKAGDQVGKLYEGLALAFSAASGIAAAFGDAGKNAGGLLTQTAQLITNLNRARKAGVGKDKDGNETNVGFAGALTGKAGAAGAAAAAASAIAVVGGVAQIADALDLFGDKARERARQLKEQAAVFNRALEDFAITERTTLEQQIKDQRTNAAALAKEARGLVESTGANKQLLDLFIKGAEDIGTSATSAQLREFIAGLSEAGKISGSVGRDARKLTERFTELADQLEENERLLQQRNAAEIARLEEDLTVRRLVARGLTEQADAERLRLEQLREIEAAEDKFGEDSPYLETLRAVQIEEAAAAAAVKKRLAEEKQAQVAQDVAARRVGLTGSDRDVFVLRQTSASRDQLAEAERLFAAGTITKELFEELSAVIRDELNASIVEFDETAAASAQRIRQDAALRLLVAQGRTEEAAALRRQIQNEEELRGITDNAVKQQIIQAQELEALAEAAAEALSEALAIRAALRERSDNRIELFDLDGSDAVRERLAGFGSAFEDLFRTFDLSTLGGLQAAKEQLRGIFNSLDSLSDEQIFERFNLTRDEVVSAILAMDTGFDGLIGSLKSVAEQAIETAQAAQDFADSLTDDFLRSQGRNREADIRAATDRRDERLKTAQQLKLGPDALEQIEAIFQADLAAIDARFAPIIDAPASENSSGGSSGSLSGSAARSATDRRGNTSVVSDFGGLSEVTGQSLAGLLREVAINTSRDGAIVESILGRGAAASLSSLSFPALPSTGGSGNVAIGTINVTIGSLNPGALSPVEAAREVTQQITRELGRIASSEARFLGSARRV